MPDCTHDELRHDYFQPTPNNPQAPAFHTIRCKKCNLLVGVFPIDRNMGYLETITRELVELRKAIYAVKEAIPKK